MPPFRSSLTALLLAVAVGFAGCAQYASVSERKPTFRSQPSVGEPLAGAERSIASGMRLQKRDPLAALGDLLTGAQIAATQLAKNPSDRTALDGYNYAVARIISTIEQANLDPWTQPLRVPAPGGDFVLSRKPNPHKAWNPALYNFTPADQFNVHGAYVADRKIKTGLGAPMVAVGKEKRADAQAEFTSSRVYYGVTAIARFEKGRRVVIAFEDPLAQETTRLDDRTFPLAADYTVPVAVMLAKTNPKKLELSRLLRPAKYAETARLVRLQPYDPKKTVVLVVHGLMDSPATWTPMINSLRTDPIIRQNYQFWYYSYPSGYPYPYSAAILRKELDAIEKKYPLQKKMVVIGHSMGGMISRLMITDSGDKLWMTMFGKPPEQTQLSAASKDTLTEALIFEHRKEIGRVIFLSAPHRGSDLASNWLGRIGSSLIKSPVTLLQVGNDMRKALTYDSSSLHLKRIPNSVDTLAPNNRFVKAVNTIPITPGIPYHSIIGDRGKGGNKDHTKPVSSDGIVPYWSSHLDGARSELIVPSNHSSHQNPQAIAEVRRILVEQAESGTRN